VKWSAGGGFRFGDDVDWRNEDQAFQFCAEKKKVLACFGLDG
jgi:hypothetical protein